MEPTRSRSDCWRRNNHRIGIDTHNDAPCQPHYQSSDFYTDYFGIANYYNHSLGNYSLERTGKTNKRYRNDPQSDWAISNERNVEESKGGIYEKRN